MTGFGSTRDHTQLLSSSEEVKCELCSSLFIFHSYSDDFGTCCSCSSFARIWPLSSFSFPQLSCFWASHQEQPFSLSLLSAFASRFQVAEDAPIPFFFSSRCSLFFFFLPLCGEEFPSFLIASNPRDATSAPVHLVWWMFYSFFFKRSVTFLKKLLQSSVSLCLWFNLPLLL